VPRLKSPSHSGQTSTPRSRSREQSVALRSVAQNGALRQMLGERRLRMVLQMIDSEPSCSVSELAREVHISPAHLQRIFKQKTGLRVSDLIGEHRLQKAARLLASSDQSIKEIAYAVGYEHHSSFVRAFHRRFAQSPSLYRNENYDRQSDNAHVHEKAAAD
jgi:AraC-like DNA-binding protein